MKKLQALLNYLQTELERETSDAPEVPTTGSLPTSGPPSSFQRLGKVKEKLKPIVENLLEHQRVLETADQVRTAELAQIQEISRFQAAGLHALIESLPDAIYIATKEGVVLCNDSALRMLGASSLEDLRVYPSKSACSSSGGPMEPPWRKKNFLWFVPSGERPPSRSTWPRH